MRPEPKFSIIDKVVIASKNYPEQNGQVHTITDMEWWESGLDPLTGDIALGGWRYWTAEDGDGIPWLETALRPYDPPADKSFHEMMEEWTKEKVK